MIKTKKIDLTKAIAPVLSENGEKLEYPELIKYVDKVREYNPQLMTQYNQSKKDTIERIDSREALEINLLIGIAERITHAPNKQLCDMWCKQFSEVSIDVYGGPSDVLVHSMLHDLYVDAREYKDSDAAAKLLLKLDSFGVGAPRRQAVHVSADHILMKGIKLYLLDNYGATLGVFTKDSVHKVIDSKALKRLFVEAMNILSQQDSAWSEWSIKFNRNAHLSVSASEKTIYIGAKRPTLTLGEAQGLFCHEVLVHAQRALHGYQRDDALGVGLPGYTEAEEGLGVLFEYACTGNFPVKIIDRYVDIALALGFKGNRPLNRKDLLDFVILRENFRKLKNDGNDSSAHILAKSMEHCNRIYRGTNGDSSVGVFTRDCTYYKGYRTLLNYIHSNSRDRGLNKTIDYLLSGKFDPSNKIHKKYLANLGQR